MKKLFVDRARLVVYLEASDMKRLSEKARSEGKTLVEWARERLLGELAGNSTVRTEPKVRLVRRRATPVMAHAHAIETAKALTDVENPESPSHHKHVCQHGTSKGYHCWQCGGLAVIVGLMLMLLAPLAYGQDMPKPHAFYDRTGKIEFGAALTAASADSAMTCKNLANGGTESGLPTNHCPQVNLFLFGQVAGQEAIAYLFHRTGHHKLERLARFYTISQNTRGFVYSSRRW